MVTIQIYHIKKKVKITKKKTKEHVSNVNLTENCLKPIIQTYFTLKRRKNRFSSYFENRLYYINFETVRFKQGNEKNVENDMYSHRKMYYYDHFSGWNLYIDKSYFGNLNFGHLT